MRGNAGKLRMVYTRPEIKWHILARHKEILVVDGECGLVAAVGSLVLSYYHPAQQEQATISSSFFIVVFPFSVDGRLSRPMGRTRDEGKLAGSF